MNSNEEIWDDLSSHSFFFHRNSWFESIVHFFSWKKKHSLLGCKVTKRLFCTDGNPRVRKKLACSTVRYYNVRLCYVILQNGLTYIMYDGRWPYRLQAKRFVHHQNCCIKLPNYTKIKIHRKRKSEKSVWLKRSDLINSLCQTHISSD